jgi:glycosyltransferase involved in cell wall biosynthesis
MRAARVVMAGNRILADAAREHASRVEVVPSCVDPWQQQTAVHRDTETLTLGWIGSPTTSAYLQPVLEVLSSMYERHRPIRLRLMGASGRWVAPWIDHVPWSVDAERRMLTEIDVGLMPLPDDPWARGKCGYKLLRYFCAGLPTISSPVGIAADMLADGRGLRAETHVQWERAIEELMGDVDVRKEMGERARNFVVHEYSFDVWAPRVAELFRGLASL